MLPAQKAATEIEMIEAYDAASLPDDPGDPGPIDRSSDQFFMSEALREARKAFRREEVPIGAVVVHEGRVIGRAGNQVELLHDATAHAEMLALTQAQSALGDWRLNFCDLFVTKEPCPMCAGAIVLCRIRRVVFGCPDEKSGAAGGYINLLQDTPLNHHCLITAGVLGEQSAALLRSFFRLRREDPQTSGTHPQQNPDSFSGKPPNS